MTPLGKEKFQAEELPASDRACPGAKSKGVSDPHMHYLTHACPPFDILGHRADDLVVPDPGPEYRSCGSGRIGGLPSSAQPYEGIVLQRNPRQRVNPISSLPILTRRNVQHGEAR